MGAITVSNLGKAYKQYPTRWARLAEWMDPRGKLRHHLHWVLQDINFTVQPGEAVGIIGINGAGKSTLLKMITGTIQPTTGSVHITGRVAALLELGMGFHHDFTGRQNAYMAGQLLGYNVEEISALMPGIESFAEIGDYIDQPVRVYSSGMQMRLAFAVATVVRPEVLIVDEALAVGDAAFQRKCHRRIESFVEKGTSLLFVSHDIEGVKKICSKVLYLSHGSMMAFGAAKLVCDQYENMLFAGNREGRSAAASQNHDVETLGAFPAENAVIDPTLLHPGEANYGNGLAEIDRVWIENAQSQRTNVLTSGEMFSVCYTVMIHEDARRPVAAMLIKTLEGIALYGTDSLSLAQSMRSDSYGKKLLVRFCMKCDLAEGIYFLNCGIRDGADAAVFYHRRVDVLMFKVRKLKDVGQVGLINLNAKLLVEPL